MAILITAATAQTDSADITVAVGSNPTFLLNGGTLELVPAGAVAIIQAKSGTQYVTIGQIDSLNPAKVLTASGVFRVRKLPTAVAVGVDQN